MRKTKKEIAVRFFVVCGALIAVSSLAFANDVTVNSGGRNIILHDNYTWEYAVEAKAGDSEIKTLTLNAKATMILKNKNGKYQLSLNPDVWEQTRGNNDSAEFQFVNNDQTGYCVVLFDGLPIPLDSMKQLVIVNAHKVDPNSSISGVEKCIVNNTEGELVTYTASASGLDFTFFTFIASKDSGTIQYTFYTLSSYFEKMKPQFLDAISGLVF
jgi:hypothetical protein